MTRYPGSRSSTAALEEKKLIPWDWMEPHPFLVEWIEENKHTGRARCWLWSGEDAAFLMRKDGKLQRSV